MGGRSYVCPVCRKTSMTGMRDHLYGAHGLKDVPLDHMLPGWYDATGLYREARKAMIQVEAVTHRRSLEFEVKGAEWEYYYRYPGGNWHSLMGNSEEDSIDSTTEEVLETYYQKHILEHPEDKLE